MEIRQKSIFILNISLFFILILTSSFSPPNAAAPESELNDISRKIKERKEQVEETKKKEKALATDLKTLGISIKKNTDDISQFNRMISEKKARIDTVNKDTGSLKTDLAKRREFLYERLRNLYKFRQNEIGLLFRSAADYQDLGRKIKYIGYIAEHDRRLIENFKGGLIKLDMNKKELEALKEGLESDKKVLSRKTKALEAQKLKKNSLLLSEKNRRSKYEKELQDLIRSSKKLRAMMKRLTRIRSVKPSSDKKFISTKGTLPWPVNGTVVLPFGKHIDPELKIPVYKNGVEIKADAGSPVEAIMDGNVVFADRFKGYGLLVIIDNGGGYHTLYGHLSEIFHKTGAIIKKGAIIGKTGMSKSLGISTLYFEIRDKGKPIDPAEWLMKNSSDNSTKK